MLNGHFLSHVCDLLFRTRRVWKPNAHNASLYSEILDKKIRLKVTTSALRYVL